MRERSDRRRWFDSLLVTMGGMAGFTASFAVWSILFPVSYSAEEIRMGAVAYLMGSAGWFLLIHSISQAVEMHQEMRAEERERPERERKIEEARLAAEAEAAARREQRDV
jgi:hypothetical protein